MADTVYNVSKFDLANNDLDLDVSVSDIRALLLATTGAGYDDPDLATVSAVLAVVGVAEPTAGERVVVTARDTINNNTDNRTDVTAGINSTSATDMVTFAADAGQSAVGVLFYRHVTNDADSIPISVHDFTSVPLDGGLTINPTDAGGDWLRVS